MPQIKEYLTIVAGVQFPTRESAIESFWRRMAVENGGRVGDPRDYIELTNVEWTERGWVLTYQAPVLDIERMLRAVIVNGDAEARRSVARRIRDGGDVKALLCEMSAKGLI